MTATNPWAGLGQRARRPSEVPAPMPTHGAPLHRTERMRQALRVHGNLTAAELAAHAQLTDTALVGALLKNDLHKHRVCFDGRRYSLTHP
jgi:hypothetical protein